VKKLKRKAWRKNWKTESRKLEAEIKTVGKRFSHARTEYYRLQDV
jgi:hypothetical protein